MRGEYGYGICAKCTSPIALDSNYEPDECCQNCSPGCDPTDQELKDPL
jgi:hypothetical protein